MSRYDEDLLENPFFQSLQNEHTELFTTATANRWIICTPKFSSIQKKVWTLVDVQDHILVPIPDSDTDFKSASDKKICIQDNVLKTGEGFELIQDVCVLFEEVFYNQKEESYRVICIDRLLTAPQEDSAKEEENSQCPHSFEECTDLLWGHSGGRKSQETLDKALNTYLNAYDKLNGENLRNIMDIAIAQFTKAMQIVLKDSSVRRSAKHSESYMDNLKIAVETYVMHSLHKKLFRSIALCVASQDAEINKITRNLSDLQLRDMGIKQQFSKTIPAAKRELSKLNKYSTPLGKLFCVKRVVKALTKPPKISTSTPDSESVEMLTTDDFLPIFIFLVVKSEVPNWMANLVYMKNFHFSKSSNNDEYGYFLASIEAALEHIQSGQLSELLPGSLSNKAEKWMQLSMNLSGETTLIRQTSTHSGDRNTAIETLFRLVTDGDEAGLKSLLSKKYELAEQIHLKLCHPLCSCDKCERLQAQSRSDTMLATPFSRDDRGYTALHVAAAWGQACVIDILIQNKAVINATDYMGSTPLHLACHKGFQNVVLLLLHFRSDPTITDNDGNTPLHLAAANGHEDCVKALLFFDAASKKIDVNAGNDMMDTPLHLAAKWGYEKIVECLLESAARIDVRNRKKQVPMSCAHARVQSLLQLAEDDSDYFEVSNLSKDVRGNSIKAVNGGQVKRVFRDKLPVTSIEIANDLISVNVDKKKVERLFKAIRSRDLELVKFYLGWSDDSDEETEIDFTRPLCHPLCQCEKCQPLQKHNPSSSDVHVNVQNSEGYGPLHEAAVHGYADLVSLFIRRGANINLLTNSKSTPLHLAAVQGHLQVAEELVVSGCKLNSRDESGNTALHLASMLGSVEIVNCLIQRGANCNQANQQGNTPLHEAVRGEKLTVAKHLLEAGAFVAVTNKGRLTPLQLATNKEMHQLLSSHLQQSVPMSPMELPHSQNISDGKESRTDSQTSHISIKDLFAAFEEKDLATLKRIGQSIKKFDKRNSLKETLTRDRSFPNLNQLVNRSDSTTMNPVLFGRSEIADIHLSGDVDGDFRDSDWLKKASLFMRSESDFDEFIPHETEILTSGECCGASSDGTVSDRELQMPRENMKQEDLGIPTVGERYPGTQSIIDVMGKAGPGAKTIVKSLKGARFSTCAENHGDVVESVKSSELIENTDAKFVTDDKEHSDSETFEKPELCEPTNSELGTDIKEFSHLDLSKSSNSNGV